MLAGHRRINRYMLECKCIPASFLLRGMMELIDTCWNLNFLFILSVSLAGYELIDTCWNVNMAGITAEYQGFNELIDTCWNVNRINTLTCNHF